MKLAKYFSLLFISAACILVVSCKKDNKCEAGSGGSLTFVAQLKHHGSVIINDSIRPDTVWIKYNAQDWSGAPAGSDAMFIGEYPEDHVHIAGLKCGDYYFYASGWDASISEVVRGGRAYSTEQTSGEIPIDIAVTE